MLALKGDQTLFRCSSTANASLTINRNLHQMSWLFAALITFSGNPEQSLFRTYQVSFPG